MFGNEFPALHGLRVVAVLLVIQAHISSGIENYFADFPFLQNASVNVFFTMDFFFTLSGFLIGFVFLKTDMKSFTAFKTFYFKRALRTLPLYYLVLLCLVLARTVPFHWEYFWQELLFLTNYPFTYYQNYHMTWSWALCVEEHFYLLCPFVMYLYFNLRTRWQVVLTAVVCAVIFFVKLYMTKNGADPRTFFGPTHFRLSSLFLGVLLAFLVSRHNEIIEKFFKKTWVSPFTFIFVPAYIVLSIVLYCYDIHRELAWGLIPSLVSSWVILFYTRKNSMRSIFAHPGFAGSQLLAMGCT